MTAAHCFYDIEISHNVTLDRFLLGAHDIIKKQEKGRVEVNATGCTLTAHPSFLPDGDLTSHDIGIITLQHPVTLTKAIKTISFSRHPSKWSRGIVVEVLIVKSPA